MSKIYHDLYNTKISLRLDSFLLSDLENISKIYDVPISNLIRNILTSFVLNYKKEDLKKVENEKTNRYN